MSLIAILDVRGIDPERLATQVAGLSLLERNFRLARVCGAKSVYLLGAENLAIVVDSFRGDTARFGTLEVLPKDTSDLLSTETTDLVLLLKGDTVFERHLLLDVLRSGTVDVVDKDHRFALLHPTKVEKGFADSSLEQLSRREGEGFSSFQAPNRWTVPITEAADVAKVEDLLFEGCRKAQDGIVSRYLNRHISLFLSRRLVSTFIRPNHISALTFTLGFLAAFAALYGHFEGFLLAGIIYQVNSIIDGVDGEIARVRYEFSVLGEWLDTISDDLSDFLFYLGLGFGAYRTAGAPPFFESPMIWMLLGLLAALGKLLSVIVYYRWLIAAGRGDLLAFQWSFENPEKTASLLTRVLGLTKYLFRKDFIVFAAMVAAIAGALPYLLFALAPGNLIVAVSVAAESMKKSS